MISPSEAADMVGKSKSAILRAIKSGTLSATRDDNNHFQIDPSELGRVFEILPEDKRTAAPQDAAPEAARSGTTREIDKRLLESKLQQLQDTIDLERRLTDRERRQYQETIDDLRARLDRESEERSKLTTRLLTDERQASRRGLFGLAKKRA